jgi:hypothetical protein
MTEIWKVPFNRPYWVVSGKLLAGGYPGSEDPIEEERKLKGLIQEGIRHVISLMEPQEYDPPGDPFVPYVDHMESIAERNLEKTPWIFQIRPPKPRSRLTWLSTGKKI